jgi:hypothetical protein
MPGHVRPAIIVAGITISVFLSLMAVGAACAFDFYANFIAALNRWLSRGF